MILPVCSVASKKSLTEFLVLKKSLEQYHDCEWFVSTDETSHKFLSKFDNVNSINTVKSDDGSHGVNDPVKNRIFLELIMTKFDALEAAIEKYGVGLFLDSDIFFTNPLEDRFLDLINNKDIDAILSPHMTNNLLLETQVGHFNVGFFAVRNKKYLNLHKQLSWKHKEFGMYYEQQPLQFTSYEFLTVNSPIYYNIGWWRFNEKHTHSRLEWLNVNDETIFLQDKPAICFHAHILKDLDYQNVASKMIHKLFSMMKSCKNEKYKDFFEYFEEVKKIDVSK